MQLDLRKSNALSQILRSGALWHARSPQPSTPGGQTSQAHGRHMLDALDLQRCHNPQALGAKVPSAGSSQHQQAEHEPPARPFRSAERARIGAASPHTDTPP